ncbi:Cysteine-rich secretory protein LCCL domain-containing 2 [Taenia crassiceps]|uniref:Cysteine-rich secretory protein LCCL domain-containing 2 n=1 Tax=Taenia crassiceps TaxID=6207 RepID=A0ABR4Q2Z6_9CEST
MRSPLSLSARVLNLIVFISAALCHPPTDIERAQILEAHLRLREKVYPPASNMELMEYSTKLENLANYWASHCRFAHPDPERYQHYSGIGQNIALISGFKPSLTESVCGWKRGSRLYSYLNNTCSGDCDPYKQMVWANSNELGCSMWQCDGLRPDWDNPQYLIVCQYSPG